MNLSVILKGLGSGLKSTASSGKLLAKKYAPEILMGSGIVGFVVTIVQTVRSTNKAHDILDSREEQIRICDEKLKEEVELGNPGNYTSSQYFHDISIIRNGSRRSLIRCWLPVAAEGIMSTGLLLGGFGMMRGRYICATTAYSGLMDLMSRYRENVVKNYGQEVDWRMLNERPDEDIQKERDEQAAVKRLEAGNKKIIPKRVKTRYQGVHGGIFDCESECWRRSWTPHQVMQFLTTKLSQLNDKLRIQHYLFVNDVFEALGMAKTPAGQLVGWVWTRDHQGHVDFGLDMLTEEQLARIYNSANEDIWVRIQLNPDGIIYDLLDSDTIR